MPEGRLYEDFAAGDVYRHTLGRTISEADATWFALLTMNTNAVHFNADFAATSEFGRVLVDSGLTVSVVLGMSVADTSQNAIANLGWTDIKLTHPVFVGDTLYGESRVLSVRESASRPHAGIVTIMTRGLNQHGDVVMTYTRTFMVPRRGTPQAQRRFPAAKQDWPGAGR